MHKRVGSGGREQSQRLLQIRDSEFTEVEYLEGEAVFEKPCTLRCTNCHAHIANSLDVTRVRKRSRPGRIAVTEVECAVHRGAELVPTAGGAHAVCKHCHTPLSTTIDNTISITATPTSLSVTTTTTTTSTNAFDTQDTRWLPLQLGNKQMLLCRPWTVAVFSLTPEEHRPICERIESTYESVNVMMVPLHLATLRSYQASGVLSPAIDLAIIAHTAEGRVLLTDQDGLYNALIKRALEVTDGNLVLILTSAVDGDVEAQLGEENVADEAVVEELAEECGQASLRVVSSRRRFWTINENLLDSHLRTLRLALDRALEPLVVPEGVAAQVPSPRLSSRVFCSVL